MASCLATLFALALLLATGSPAAAGVSRTHPRTVVGTYEIGVGTYTIETRDTGRAERGLVSRVTLQIETVDPRTGTFAGRGNENTIFGKLPYEIRGTVWSRKIQMRASYGFGVVAHDSGRIRADGTITGRWTSNNGERGTWVMKRGTWGASWWKSTPVVSVALLVLLVLLSLLGARLYRRKAPTGLGATTGTANLPLYWPPPPGWEANPVLPPPVDSPVTPPSDQPPFWPPPPDWKPTSTQSE